MEGQPKIEIERDYSKFYIIYLLSKSISMNKKASQFLSKLWKMTPFCILSSPGKQESQIISQSLKSISKCFNFFQQSINGILDELKLIPINIPCLVKMKNQILKIKGRSSKFIKQQAECVTKTINALSQFRFVLQKSEMTASNQYIGKVQQLLNSKDEGVRFKKIQQVHQQVMSLKYNEKLIVKNSLMSSSLEKWLCDFSIRAQDFYMKLYSADWSEKNLQTKAISIPFMKLRNEDNLSGMVIKTQEHKNQNKAKLQNQQQQQQIREDSSMKEQENDIVSQIFKELEPKCKVKKH